MKDRPVRRGRPRAFDAGQALDQALKVFWAKGYEGASLPDLTRAMGINRPSLYAAFGNKEALFKKAVERYGAGPACYVGQAMDAPTARLVFRRLLDGEIALLTDPRHPPGCLLVQGALTCGDDAAHVRDDLAARRASMQALLRKRFRRARAEGDLPRSANPADLARYAGTVLNGLAVQAVGGARRRELQRVADLAMRAWPV